MTSEKQAQANRRNALKSTGPKTPEGKAAVRLNANKHGLRSREVLLPGEDEEALKELDSRPNFHPGCRQGQRLLQTLPLRNSDMAEPLQGPARASASSSRPPYRG